MRSALAAILSGALGMSCGRIGFDPTDEPGPGGIDADILDGDLDGDAAINTCSESPCRYLPTQCGCAGGENCSWPINDMNLAACVSAGSSPQGSVCTVPEDCEIGSGCISLGDYRVCNRLCEQNPNCAGDSPCFDAFGLTTVGLCGMQCEPESGTGCGSGLICRPTLRDTLATGAATWTTICTEDGTLATGSACSTSTLCRAGNACINGFCMRVCEVADPPGGCTCQAFGTPPFVVGGRSYGACI